MDSLEGLVNRFEQTGARVERDVSIPGYVAGFVAVVPKRFVPQMYFGFNTTNLTPDALRQIRQACSKYAMSKGRGLLKTALIIPVIHTDSLQEAVVAALEEHSANAGIYEIPVIVSDGKLWLRQSLRSDTSGLAHYTRFRKNILGWVGATYEIQN